jgi:hypothetical protein
MLARHLDPLIVCLPRVPPLLVCLPCSAPSRVPVFHPFSHASRVPPLLACLPHLPLLAFFPRPPLHIPTHSRAPSASCPFPCAFHTHPFSPAHRAALGFTTPAWKKCYMPVEVSKESQGKQNVTYAVKCALWCVQVAYARSTSWRAWVACACSTSCACGLPVHVACCGPWRTRVACACSTSHRSWQRSGGTRWICKVIKKSKEYKLRTK